MRGFALVLLVSLGVALPCGGAWAQVANEAHISHGKRLCRSATTHDIGVDVEDERLCRCDASLSDRADSPVVAEV
jgi:hypothetical protein